MRRWPQGNLWYLYGSRFLTWISEVYGDQVLGPHGDLLQMERYMEREAASFAEQFDARCYATLCEAYSRADLYDFLPTIKSQVLVVSASNDALAPPERVRDDQHRLLTNGTPCEYVELQSQHGHRAFYREAMLGQIVARFIEK